MSSLTKTSHIPLSLQQQLQQTVSPIDFDRASTIVGTESHALLVQLEPGQVLRAETGAMLFMTAGIDMNTSMGGSTANDRIQSGLKRLMTGQNLFISDFTYLGSVGTFGTVGLGTDFPSKIIRFTLKDYGHKLVCQKGAFLAGSANVQIEIEFTKSFISGFFGSEGFILQALLGDGDVFCKAGGMVIKKQLKTGETLRVASGSLVAFTQDVQYDVQMMPGFKNVLFGGEGLFITTLQGPGIVWLQGMSPDRMISEIVRRMPSGGGMGIPIPIPLGGGGGDSSSTSNDESIVAQDKVDAPLSSSDLSKPNTLSSPHDIQSGEAISNIESESPSALFGDAVSTKALSEDTFESTETTNEHHTSTAADNTINDTEDTFSKEKSTEMSNELPDEEFSEEDSDSFEIEQTAVENQDDSSFGLFRKIWDFFRGGD